MYVAPPKMENYAAEKRRENEKNTRMGQLGLR